MSQVFRGELVVEDDAFELRAERLIIRDGAIGFSLEGRDAEYGEYLMDGEAKLTEHGFYFAAQQPLTYKSYDEEGDVASIKFLTIELSPAGKVCKVNGEWIENGGTYPFSGTLNLR